MDHFSTPLFLSHGELSRLGRLLCWAFGFIDFPEKPICLVWGSHFLSTIVLAYTTTPPGTLYARWCVKVFILRCLHHSLSTVSWSGV